MKEQHANNNNNSLGGFELNDILTSSFHNPNLWAFSLLSLSAGERERGERERERAPKMGKVVERKKKKKGRPSLLDLQKRTLREQEEQLQQQQQQQQKRKNNSARHSNPNYKTAPADSAKAPVRRSTRRNPNPDDNEDEDDGEDEDDDVLAGKRREKKLKLVLKLPPNQKSSANSASLNSGGSESNADGDNAAPEVDKKRKINAIGDGSGLAHPQKVLKFWVKKVGFSFGVFYFRGFEAPKIPVFFGVIFWGSGKIYVDIIFGNSNIP